MSVADGVYALAVALGVSGLVVDAVAGLAPRAKTSDFFEVASIRAERDGDSANLYVDRVIKAPIHMSFTVRIMEKTSGGWREFCSAPSSAILYQPSAVLDQPVTLDWWTWGKCPVLPDGPARIATTWEPSARGLEPTTTVVEVE